MMLGHGKCPKCEKPVDHCEFEQIILGDNNRGPALHALSACCPHCQTVLGVFPDPSAFAADVALRALERVQKGR